MLEQKIKTQQSFRQIETWGCECKKHESVRGERSEKKIAIPFLMALNKGNRTM